MLDLLFLVESVRKLQKDVGSIRKVQIKNFKKTELPNVAHGIQQNKALLMAIKSK